MTHGVPNDGWDTFNPSHDPLPWNKPHLARSYYYQQPHAFDWQPNLVFDLEPVEEAPSIEIEKGLSGFSSNARKVNGRFYVPIVFGAVGRGDGSLAELTAVEAKQAVSEAEHLAAYVARLGNTDTSLMLAESHDKGPLFVSTDYERYPPVLSYVEVTRLGQWCKFLRSSLPNEPVVVAGRVVLFDLESQPQLNGMHGTVISWLVSSGRWEIQLDDRALGKTVNAKPPNVQHLEASWAERSRGATVWANVRGKQLQTHSDAELLQAKSDYVASFGQDAYDEYAAGSLAHTLLNEEKARDFYEKEMQPAIDRREQLFLDLFAHAVRARQPPTARSPHRLSLSRLGCDRPSRRRASTATTSLPRRADSRCSLSRGCEIPWSRTWRSSPTTTTWTITNGSAGSPPRAIATRRGWTRTAATTRQRAWSRLRTRSALRPWKPQPACLRSQCFPPSEMA